MEIEGKSIMILGGWGQVGIAVGRTLIQENPKRLIISSLRDEESVLAVEELKKVPNASETEFSSFGGNILVRKKLEKIPIRKLLEDRTYRTMLIEDVFGEKFFEIAENSFIYEQFQKYCPDVVIDCINTATALAYQPLYDSVRRIRKAISEPAREKLAVEVEKLICTLYVPQLIRHVQILYYTMRKFKTKMYIKIGTSGTGGMGLNIPYTHSEEKPSSALLSKSSVAGAHTLLLYLMARTPDAPIIKEIKPTAAICWKEIDYGGISRKGEIHLHDCPPENALILNDQLTLNDKTFSNPTGETLQSVYIDTGENGQFSLGEFTALTALGQMEFVTPEEIASIVISEIKGRNTGHDMISAFDSADLGPSYRAGVLRSYAINVMKEMECSTNTDSVAFLNLGPPRLSKLLYEAHLLKQCCHTVRRLATSDAKALSDATGRLVIKDASLRSRIISIGIPVLLGDGKKLIRGPEVSIPVNKGDNTVEISGESIEKWAESGWVDLRKKNMQKWIDRAQKILMEAKQSSNDRISSQFERGEWFWNNDSPLTIGELVGWIFITEDKGRRMKG
ncbi:MAG: short-chain dehydrogenase [Theionarchaea archaeon]|nr:short-chain dehydrogenase [Theionarchaea archaeon]